MPTPVSSARQCLAGEAAAALDEAVSIARRRAHAQTTSLHVVSALLSLPSSSSSLLRDALSRTRSAAHSPRFQFKALELCFSLALDRLPSAATGGKNSPYQGLAEPPISNSLMAAIKRSQATQRRNPDTFHLYQHYQQLQEQSSSSVGVKVELQQLVLSILDDPIVSRVFADAGFRSYDIKFAVLHPPPSILRLPRAARCPPLFLCNFSIDVDLTSSPHLYSDVADENCRRIAEVLVRKAHRNPLLVGIGAADATLDFERAVNQQNWVVFPPEARGVKFFSVEKDLLEYARGAGRDRACGSSPGIVLSFGNLKLLVDVVGEGDGLERVSHVASELTRLLDGHPGKLWLIGSAATYETYMKFLSQYPSVDKDWDLQLLPISSPKLGSGGSSPDPTGFLMDSFVPLGGFFPVPPNSLSPQRGQCHSVPCHLCSDKYEQELASLLDRFSEKHRGSHLIMQAKDDGATLNAKIIDLRKKWSDICLGQHRRRRMVASDDRWLGSEAFPGMMGKFGRETAAKGDFLHLSNVGAPDELTSPSSVSSVSTDLMLGTVHSPLGVISKEKSVLKLTEPIGDDSVASVQHPARWVCSDSPLLVTSLQVQAAAAGGSACDRRSPCPSSVSGDFKGFFRSLSEKVGRQEDAIFSICETISRCRNGNERLRGSTPRGTRVAAALAELLFGCRERLVCVDLSLEDALTHRNAVCEKHAVDKFDLNRRGKTVVDHIAEEIRRRPWSVVLVEGLDKADVLVQSSLSRAIKSGKFHDSHGREIDINNVVFVTTVADIKCKGAFQRGHAKFSEERILAAEARQMKILIDTSLDSAGRNLNTAECGEEKREFVGSAKRANTISSTFLDLNLPVEEMVSADTDSSNGCVSDNQDSWMEEFHDAVDETVLFKGFDFDALAGETLQEIEKSIHAAIGFSFALEIEPKIMDQILAAAWISESGSLKNWLQQVLVRSLVEAQQSYRLSASSVVRLVACEETGVGKEDCHAPEIPLPSRILPCELICHSFL
ncbi:unnamed protein product [Spirodela intermedia]|uniref:Clp R domain-containing protein n=1 Tax=Spirodela intermedia TaxID=51605 RepID=A0A7I8IAQ4_SPIIN|nr:unnamed protein product [Spirodela intermedia]CAA6654765.1 unnamed protein product [Spirodela intermedia]